MPGLDASESQLLDLWLDLGTSNSILGVFRQEYRHTVENSDQLLDRTPRGYYQSRRLSHGQTQDVLPGMRLHFYACGLLSLSDSGRVDAKQ